MRLRVETRCRWLQGAARGGTINNSLMFTKNTKPRLSSKTALSYDDENISCISPMKCV